MSDTGIAVIEPRAVTARSESQAAPKVTGKLSQVLDLMVYEGKRYADACLAVGLHPRSARKALDKPHVLKELSRRKQVFRANVCAANISRLEELRDTSANAMARIAAIKTLEQFDDEPTQRASSAAFPGITVVINAPGSHTPQMQTIEHKPLIDNGDG